MITFNFEKISSELKKSHRWVLWQLEDVQDGEKLRKNMKPPYDAKTGRPARHNDFSTWTSYEIAEKAHRENLKLIPTSHTLAVYPTRGIGFVLGPPFFGIDLDDVRNPETGEISADARQWIEEADSYTEISPSGTGVHIFGHGTPPYPEGHRKDGREIYSTNRYLTMTGAVLEGHEEIRRFSDGEVKDWYNRIKNYSAKKDPANPVASVTTSATTSQKIAEMMTATDFPDLSVAVMSLLTLLAIQHLLDPVKIVEDFKKSRLYTDTHWGEKWERVGEESLRKAIEFARENLAKRKEREKFEETRRIDLINDADIQPKPLVYVWDPVLPKGKLVHFCGASSQGKSPVTVDLLARITRGAPWPDGQPNTMGPKKVLLMNIEDGIEDMTLPRYQEAGGVKGSLFFAKMATVTKGEYSYDAMIALDRDMLSLAEISRQIEDLGLIVIDPITNYLGGLKMNAEEEMRAILTPLAGLAEELGIPIVTVGHLNKNNAGDPLQRVMGATAFVGVARSVYMFLPDEQQPENHYAHVIAPIRGDMGTSYKYTTEAVKREINGIESRIVRVVWGGTCNQRAEDSLGKEKITKDTADEIKEAAEVLHNFLLSGKRDCKACLHWLREQGYDPEKLGPSRIRKAAGVKSQSKGNKGTEWFLPASQQSFEPTEARRQKAEEVKKDDAPEH